MGNAVATSVYLDHETKDEREAVEAGESLSGQVVIDVEDDVDPGNLYIKLYGKEICYIRGRDTSSKDELIFFQTRLQLYQKTDTDQILPNRYVFPFDVPLPAALPSSFLSDEHNSHGNFGIEYSLMVCDETKNRLRYTRLFDIVSAEDEKTQVRPCVYQAEPFFAEDIDPEKAGKIYLGAKVSDVNLIHGEELELTLSCRNQSTAIIERIDVAFEEQHSWFTDTAEASVTLTLAEKQHVNEIISTLRIEALEDASQAREDLRVDEVTARRMHRGLKKSSSSHFRLPTPLSAQESFHGSLIQVSHRVKVTVVTDVKPDLGYLSFEMPIQVRSKAYGSLDDSLSIYQQDEEDVTFPKATANRDCIIMGRDASMEGWWDYGYKAEESSPSLAAILDDLALSLDQHDLIVTRMKDIEWAIFCGSMTPKDFGKVIQQVHFGDLQTTVGILIATSYGGDFTCAHCVAGIAKTHKVFRPAMAEALLPYCSDLADGSEVIRGQLSEFEQIIIALRALDGDEEDEEDEHYNSRASTKPSLRPRAKPRPSDVNSLNESANVQPEDICIRDEKHEGTVDLLYTIRDIVEADPVEFSPAVYRCIRKRIKGQRFLIRPFDELPHYWRVASDREKIAYCGQCYDRDRKNTLKAKDDEWGEENDTVEGKTWHKNLCSDGGSEWVLAMTVHSCAYDVHHDDDGEDDRPMPGDVCFGKKRHPGNEAMNHSIRKNLVEFNYMEWAPPVYQAIKADLRGRVYYVPNEQGGWERATFRQRRTEMGKIYDAEKKARKSAEASAPLPPVDQSGCVSVKKSGKSFGASMSSLFTRKKNKKKESKEVKMETETVEEEENANQIDRKDTGIEKLNPDDGDVCFGLNTHPGTKLLHAAILKVLPEFEDAEWSPTVYKAIRAQIKEAHFFVRTEIDSPWREASTRQRILRVRQQFEFSQKKRKMKVGEEALVS